MLLTFVLIGCSSENKSQTDLSNIDFNKDIENANLFGKVKSVKVNTYRAEVESGEIIKGQERYSLTDTFVVFNEKGYIIEQISYAENGKIKTKKTFTYNENGNLITIYDIDSLENKYKNYSFEYNENGNLITIQDEIILSEKEYEYDKKGNNININYRTSGANSYLKEIFTYNEKGNVKEKQQHFEKKSHLDTKSNFFYDKEGNMSEYYLYNANGDLERRDSYKYDEKGNRTNWIKYNSNESVVFMVKYEHDEYGNMTKYINIDYIDGETLSYQRDYKYNYDEMGNWVQRVEYEFGLPSYIIEREIEYYE